MFIPSEFHAAPSCTAVRSSIFGNWVCDLFEPIAGAGKSES
jgi:hypothetical protein